MLFMLLFVPTRMVAQTEYDKTVTLTALAGNPKGYDNEKYGNLVDGNNTKWCCKFDSNKGAYVIFEASKAGVPVGYTITTGDDNETWGAGRNPLSWKLYGNNEGEEGEWVLIDKVENDGTLQDKNCTSYDFTCEGSTSYKYFKWEISAIHSGSTLQVGEFKLKLQTCSHKNADGSSALGEAINTVETTCTEHGYTTKECSICHLIVKEYLNDELKKHTLTHHEAKDEVKEHWQCDVCHKYFSDANATQEVNYASLIYKGYAVFDEGTGTLTFKYGTSKPEEAYDLNVKKWEHPGWKSQRKNIKKVVFDASFANARPTICDYWFYECEKLTDIEGIENLNTEKVTSMESMFRLCDALTSLDLTNFNTTNVTSMHLMFDACFELTTIYASDKFVTTNVTSSSNMFWGCKKLKGYDDGKTDHYYANCSPTGYFTSECEYAVFDNATGTLTFRYKGAKPEGAYDLNVGATEPGWRTHKKEITKVVFATSFANARPTSCYYWFYECENLTNIEGIENLNTEKVTNMALMFAHCFGLTSLDVTKFNTANVTTLMSMFARCSGLKSLDVTNFDTKNVKDMYNMFNSCTLKSLDLTNFNTANVTAMDNMFKGCSALTSLDLTNFNTAEVTNMNHMFFGCSALKTIYASDKFVTTKVKADENMFYGCKSLKGYEDSKVDHNYANCSPTGYFTSKCEYAVFDNATGTLTFRYKGVKPEGAYDLNVKAITPQWKNIGPNVKKVVFDASFASARPTICYAWFYNNTNLTTIEGIEYLNTENVTNMGYMFAGCSALKSLDLTKFNTAKVTSMEYMFNKCSALKSLNLLGFNTEKVTNMNSMFRSCSALESLDLSMFNTENVTSMPNMFNGAKNLKTLNVSSFNTEKVKNMGHMFANCPNLTSLDLSSFNTKGVEYVDNIFKNCSNLTTIYASENFAFGSGLKNGADMFLGCDKLKGFIEYNKNTDTDKNNSEFANYKTGYFTKLVGKNGEEKIGAAGEPLAAYNLALDDNKDFVAYEPFAAKAASYSRTINTTWATLCLPFEVSLDNQNFRAFKLLSADDVAETVELEEIETSIAAGTPVIIKMKDGAKSLSISEADKAIAKDVLASETANGNYQLQGIYTQKEFSKDADNHCYIVKGDKLMNPAKLLEATATEFVGSKPFRAYMVDNSSAPAAGARMFSISIGGSTTAIKQLESTADSKAEYYDLQGRRLQNLQKGVNIVKRGGKTMKVIIK